METPNPWPQVVQTAARTAFGASLCPIVAGLAYLIFKNYGAVYAVLYGGGAVLLLSILTWMIALFAAGKDRGNESGCVWFASGLLAIFIQILLAMGIAALWASRYREEEPDGRQPPSASVRRKDNFPETRMNPSPPPVVR